MSTPVTVKGGIEELRQRVAAGHHSYAIALGGGIAISRKTIRVKTKRWMVTNHIDGSTQRLTDEELWTLSNIGAALDAPALGDLDGNDDLVNVKGEGWRRGEEWLAEVREAIPPREQTDPFRFTLSDGPGAIRIGEDEGEWEPANPSLVLEACDIGPATVASIDLAATGMGFADETVRQAATSIELTIEDIDGLIATLTALRVHAIAHRGFAKRDDGYWTNGRD